MAIYADSASKRALDMFKVTLRDTIDTLRAEVKGMIEDKHKLLLRVCKNETIHTVDKTVSERLSIDGLVGSKSDCEFATIPNFLRVFHDKTENELSELKAQFAGILSRTDHVEEQFEPMKNEKNEFDSVVKQALED